MNDAQNPQDVKKKFKLPPNMLWIGGIVLLVICTVVFFLVFMSSSEKPNAFLAKWKSALESGDVKRYESLWVKSARQRPDTSYRETENYLREDVGFEVNLSTASEPYRVPRYPKRYRIDGVSVRAFFPGEVQQQLRNLVIEKKGLVQQRWKLVQEEIAGSDLTATLDTTDPTAPPGPPTAPDTATLPPDSPVTPVVVSWKSALESGNVKAYTDLWDKSAKKRRAANFKRASDLLSQGHLIDMAAATYQAVPGAKNRHEVDNIQVTLESGGAAIETHVRTLTIEKKGFFRRKWKIINDEVNMVSAAVAAVPELPAADTVSGEESGNSFDGNAPLDTQLKVRQILGKWQEAWESKDLRTYMSIYSDQAQITRVTVRDGRETSTYLSKGQLRQKMQKLNSMYGDIQVAISNLQVNGDRAVADVKFLQKFTGTPASGSRPAYSDYGTKKLNLMVDPADGHWRIYAETWSRYEDVPDFPKM